MLVMSPAAKMLGSLSNRMVVSTFNWPLSFSHCCSSVFCSHVLPRRFPVHQKWMSASTFLPCLVVYVVPFFVSGSTLSSHFHQLRMLQTTTVFLFFVEVVCHSISTSVWGQDFALININYAHLRVIEEDIHLLWLEPIETFLRGLRAQKLEQTTAWRYYCHLHSQITHKQSTPTTKTWKSVVNIVDVAWLL